MPPCRHEKDNFLIQYQKRNKKPSKHLNLNMTSTIHPFNPMILFQIWKMHTCLFMPCFVLACCCIQIKSTKKENIKKERILSQPFSQIYSFQILTVNNHNIQIYNKQTDNIQTELFIGNLPMFVSGWVETYFKANFGG